MMVEMRKVDEPEKKQGQEDAEDKNASFVSGFEYWWYLSLRKEEMAEDQVWERRAKVLWNHFEIPKWSCPIDSRISV